MENTLLTSNALSERWGIKPDTLSQWRWNGRGPKFLKIGGRVLYRLSDIEEFETEHLQGQTKAVVTSARSIRECD